MTTRVAYVNGQILPESEATISFRDNGFVYGDAVFDTSRTFAGTLFRLDDHLDRLYRTLDLVRIDPGLSRAQMRDITVDVTDRNRAALASGEDFLVSQRISSGIKACDGEPYAQDGPTVVVECTPLPLRARAQLFVDGIDAVLASRPRIAPAALSPNAKTNNYLNMMLAQREVHADAPGAWALMPDCNGNVAEGPGSNVFIVVDGELHTPTTEFVLAGVSRQVVLELAVAAGLPVVERDIAPAELGAATEAFFTSTSLCICPVRAFAGAALPGGVPGPVTRQLSDAFCELVGMDFREQYLRFAGAGATVAGL